MLSVGAEANEAAVDYKVRQRCVAVPMPHDGDVGLSRRIPCGDLPHGRAYRPDQAPSPFDGVPVSEPQSKIPQRNVHNLPLRNVYVHPFVVLEMPTHGVIHEQLKVVLVQSGDVCFFSCPAVVAEAARYDHFFQVQRV